MGDSEGPVPKGEAVYLIWVVVIGILAGWLAGQLTKGRGFGVLGDLVVGVIGSLLGSFVFALLGIYAGSIIGRLILAVIGSILLLYLIRFIRRT